MQRPKTTTNTGTNLASMLDGLSQLPASDLKTLRDHAGALLAMKGGSAPVQQQVAVGKSDWVLQTLVDVMKQNGMPFGGVNLLQSSNSYPSYKQKRPGLISYLDKVGTERQTKRAVLFIAFGLMARDLADLGITVGPSVLLRNVHRLPATLDRHFPGYAQAGLLSALVKDGHDGSRRSDHTHAERSPQKAS